MRRFLYAFLCCSISLLQLTCVKDLDFDQAKDLEITPTFKIALAHSSIEQTLFVSPSGAEVPSITDQSNFYAFENSITKDLTKIELDFEVKNPFNRRFVIDFRLLDENGGEAYDIPALEIPENAQKFEHKEVIDVVNNPNVLNTKKIEAVFSLLPSTDGSIIDINVRKVFSFKSAGTFYFKID
ncbi:hypothetical protein [Tenacibaculum sp. 190524A02b]|uniref:hypothetical protein n=1 Tax=Tenacibaculum vairaonense TaxID=3137860 RepID=UPI0031FAC6E5